MSEMSNTGSADTSPDTVNLCNTDRLGNIASLYLAHYLGIDIERFASISKILLIRSGRLSFLIT